MLLLKKNDMVVRLAKRVDISILTEFQLAMALETENLVLDKTVLEKGIESLFKDSTKGSYYVAEESEKIIGCLMTTYEWSDWRNGNVLWIQSVYIHKRFRGKGVYKKMYEYIQQIVADSVEFRGIRLYVDKTNLNAKKVYQQLGMNGEHYQVFEWMKN
jgi:ribosomal protein S18 acetylase RimI-like enzyme